MLDCGRLDAFVDRYSLLDSQRFDSCRAFWDSFPTAEWGSVLLEVLARYRQFRQQPLQNDQERRASFALNELTTSCYAHRPRFSEQESLAILRTAFHTCGHGTDTYPPLELALKHFHSKPYTPEFFDAVNVYRETLRATRNVTAQQLKARLELILWQDWRDKHHWRTCWTSRIRKDLTEMSGPMRPLWGDLLRRFQVLPHTEPPKKWLAACSPPLEKLSAGVFSARMRNWLGEAAPATKPSLTTPGSHILKNLIWCAAAVNDPALDRSLMTLADVPWKTQGPVTKVVGALAYVWSCRDSREATPYLERIARRYAYPGGKIELYYRTARDAWAELVSAETSDGPGSLKSGAQHPAPE